MADLTPMERAITANYEFTDCEYCTHCVTINDDMDKLCTLKNRVVWDVCGSFQHFEGKTRTTHEAEALGDKESGNAN